MFNRWFDADTIFLNPNVPWTLFVPPSDFEDIHLLATKDHHGLNAGMLMLRVHAWTVSMLAEVVSLRHFKPNLELEYYDQSALKYIIERPGYEEHCAYQPHDWWNAFGLQGKPYATPAFMLHFAGVDCCRQPEKKGVVMGRWLDELEVTPQKYSTPLEDTMYPGQVAEYWGMLRNASLILNMADKWQQETLYTERDIRTARAELKDTTINRADDVQAVGHGISKIEKIINTVTPGAVPFGMGQVEKFVNLTATFGKSEKELEEEARQAAIQADGSRSTKSPSTSESATDS